MKTGGNWRQRLGEKIENNNNNNNTFVTDKLFFFNRGYVICEAGGIHTDLPWRDLPSP